MTTTLTNTDTSNVVNAAELTKRAGGSKTRKVGAVDWLME